MASEEIVAQALALLGELPGSPMNETTAKLYRATVLTRDLSDIECRRLIVEAIRRCRFRPTPAELLAILADMRGDAMNPSGVMAELTSAVAYGGRYEVKYLEWTDPDGTRRRERATVWRPGKPNGLSDRAEATIAALGGWEQVVCLNADNRLGAAVAAVCRELNSRGMYSGVAARAAIEAGQVRVAAIAAVETGEAERLTTGGQTDE